jgi:hypothetical protein
MSQSQRALFRAIQLAVILGVTTGVTAGPIQSFFGRGSVDRPPAGEFGFGPRPSAKQVYTATLQPVQPLRLRQLQTVPVRIVDAKGQPVEGARIAIDGGMPEHSHGLPTRPLVKRSLGDGVYEIEGLRFSMGGWWELKLAIESPGGADRVTFNLAL